MSGETSTGAPASTDSGLPEIKEPLSTETRLKLARSIIDQTCDQTGAGYMLVMFLPGSDMVLRSFKGIDSPEECVALTAEVAGLMQRHSDVLRGKAKQALHNAH